MTVADVTERQRFAVDLALDARLVEVAAQEAWVRVALHQLVDLRQTYVTRHTTRHTTGSAGTSRSSSASGSVGSRCVTRHNTVHAASSALHTHARFNPVKRQVIRVEASTS